MYSIVERLVLDISLWSSRKGGTFALYKEIEKRKSIYKKKGSKAKKEKKKLKNKH